MHITHILLNVQHFEKSSVTIGKIRKLTMITSRYRFCFSLNLRPAVRTNAYLCSFWMKQPSFQERCCKVILVQDVLLILWNLPLCIEFYKSKLHEEFLVFYAFVVIFFFSFGNLPRRSTPISELANVNKAIFLVLSIDIFFICYISKICIYTTRIIVISVSWVYFICFKACVNCAGCMYNLGINWH